MIASVPSQNLLFMKARTCGVSQVVRLGTKWNTWHRITVLGKKHIFKKEYYFYSKQIGGKVWQNLLRVRREPAFCLTHCFYWLYLLFVFQFDVNGQILNVGLFLIFSYASGVFGKWVFMWICLWRCHLDGGWGGMFTTFVEQKAL